jgi:hypothetical protein
MNIEHELRVIRVLVEDHRRESQAQVRALREAIELSIANSVRLEIARELMERVPGVRGEVKAWLAGYGLILEPAA